MNPRISSPPYKERRVSHAAFPVSSSTVSFAAAVSSSSCHSSLRNGAVGAEDQEPEPFTYPWNREILPVEDVPQAWDLGDQSQARRDLPPPRPQGRRPRAGVQEAPQVLPRRRRQDPCAQLPQAQARQAPVPFLL